ncbi:4Fe-4S dicluster domain-containing protein [Desulfocurvus sp. DL9XJH121]
MKQLGLMIDMDRCIGCKTCVVACRNAHKIVDHEKCLPGQIPYYIRVETECTGVYPNPKQDFWVVPCQHCKNAACVKACEAGAITKDPSNGIVLIDAEKCVGKGSCVPACPYGVIQFDAVLGKAHKCDLCHDRVVAGKQPVCVEVCMTDALVFGEKEMLRMLAESKGKIVQKKLSAMSMTYVYTPA